MSNELQQHDIFVDNILLTQIITNILSNAIDAIGESSVIEGLIRITTFIDSTKTLQIHIEDNGTGITKDREDTIFEPFYSTKETGSGIGLSWSKSTIEAMGGAISLRSKGKSLPGAYLVLSLPVEMRQVT